MRRNSKTAPLNKSLIFPALGAGLSAAMNGWYGWQWDPWAIGGAGLALGALVSDGIKPSLAPAIIKDVRNWSLASALFKTLVLLVLISISAFAAFSFVASATEKTTGPANAQRVKWMDLKTRKAKKIAALDQLAAVETPAEITSRIKALRAQPIQTHRGAYTVGYMMECGAVGTKAYGKISQKYCPVLTRLEQDLTKALNKVKLTSIIDRIQSEMDQIGAPVEVDPGAARAAAALGMDQDQVRSIVLALMALAVELIATFGQLLGKSAPQRPTKTAQRPKTVHDWLVANADKNGTLQAGYDEIGRALNISKSTAWRHAKKLIDAGIVTHDHGMWAVV